MSSETKLPVLHNVAAKRFEVNLDGKLAFSKYLLVGEKMIIEHTEVPSELEGKGIAGTIVRTALDYARAQRLGVIPLSPFPASFTPRHPQYQVWVLEGYGY